MTPAHDERMNITEKGLSSDAYRGHTFWDTEIFILPYYTFTHPDMARRLVRYRCLSLESACGNARRNGWKGAQFPWEAAGPNDGETSSEWGGPDLFTGEFYRMPYTACGSMWRKQAMKRLWRTADMSWCFRRRFFG